MLENGRYVTPVRTVLRTVLSCRLEPSSEQFLPLGTWLGWLVNQRTLPHSLSNFNMCTAVFSLPTPPPFIWLRGSRSLVGHSTPFHSWKCQKHQAVTNVRWGMVNVRLRYSSFAPFAHPLLPFRRRGKPATRLFRVAL